MSVYTKTVQLSAANTDTATFTLPKSDIADLRRSSRSIEPLDDESLLEEFSGDVGTLLVLLEEFRSNGPQRLLET